MAEDADFVVPANAFTHRFEVPGSDIDELGHAGNVAWVRWVNEAAGEHSRSVGLGLEAYREMGLVWVVRKHAIEYLGQALAGEALESVTWIVSLKGATSLRRTLIRRAGAGQLLARAETTWALLAIASGRPTRIPKQLLERYGFAADALNVAGADPELFERATALAANAPLPALSGNVLCGTAGWTDRSLIASGLFYPRGATSARARLAHYAEHFSLVEVDATYYSILPPETAMRWLDATPEHFRFDVKAHPVLTGHPIDVTRLPKDLAARVASAGLDEARVYADKLPGELRTELEARFLALLEPLVTAGRLGCLMLQFPPWFGATRGNARRIETLAEQLAGIPLAVEFRNASWLGEDRRARVFDLLRALGIAYVGVDEPDAYGGGVPPVVEVTDERLAIVRFHGQNVRGWHKGASVAERFDYLYSPEELQGWVAPVRRLAARAGSVHAVFNNCVGNYAVLDAKGLAVLLETAPPEPT